MSRQRRVMIADFDSIRQRDLWLSLGAAEATRRSTAVLRLACLLEERVLLTDAQLLDGMYFVTHGPDEVAAMLGCEVSRLPLTVAVPAQCDSLADAFRLKSAADSGFLWSSTAVAKANSPSPQDAVRAFQARREEWLAAEAAGRLDIARYEPFDPAVLRRHLGAAQRYPDGQQTHAWPEALLNCRARSEALGVIEETFGPIEREGHARGTYDVWDRAYQQAIAETNHASWLSLTSSDRAGPAGVSVGGALIDDLADISGPVHALVSQRSAAAVGRWRQSPSRSTIQDVAYAVRETLAPAASLRATFWGAVFRFVAPVLLTIAVWAATVGASRMPPWVPAAAGALGVVAAVPWGEIPQVLGARRGKLKALIRVDLS